MTDRIAIPTLTDEDMAPRTSPMATGKQTRPVLEIDGEKRQVTVSEYDPGENSTPIREWLGFVKSIELTDADMGTTVKASALAEYLNSDDGQALLARICDGADSEWDGSNMRPTFTDDAETALAELTADIESLDTETWQIEDAGDWLQDDDLAAYWGLNIATTDDGLDEIAKKIQDDATTSGSADHTIIEGLDEYLMSARQDMRDEAMSYE